MMSLGPLGFLSPWLLAVGIILPLIWWLLRITPPSPLHIFFPPTRLLLGINKDEQDKAHSPWWLTLLRLIAAAALILALARPVLNPQTTTLAKSDLLVAFIDNGWASAANWQQRRTSMRQLLELAERNNNSVLLIPTANIDERRSLKPLSAFKAREQFAGFTPHPFAPDRMKALTVLQKANHSDKNVKFYWLSDGLDYGHANEFATKITVLAENAKDLTIVKNGPKAIAPLALHALVNKKGNLQATIISPGGISYEGHVRALDGKGRSIFHKPFKLAANATDTNIDFVLPLELRNQIARVEIKGMRAASTRFLIDGRAKWQRIGLISSEASEEAQPLLSPLYYIKKALQPFNEMTEPKNKNTAKATDTLLARHISTLILAGIGRLQSKTSAQLEDWLQRGGMLIRFAGPRLEQGGGDLLPVPLRQGGRALGGALSWSKPQKLAAFEENSPFFGLELPNDVSVKRQVLADPSKLNDRVMIWARLEDGTPLVTARKTGRGLLVLFHITANSTWSDLPHSGLFVDMLRRLVGLSSGIIPKTETSTASSDKAPATKSADSLQKEADLPALPPIRILNGFGNFTAPTIHTEPVKITDLDHFTVSKVHPPGLYGTTRRSRALNIASPKLQLTPLPAPPANVTQEYYKASGSYPLAPLMFTLALILFLIDSLIVSLMQGLLAPAVKRSSLKKTAQAGALALLAGTALLSTDPALAAPAEAQRSVAADAFGLNMSLETHLAYVRTGRPDVDRISRLGLTTLSKQIARRSAFEPVEPVGVDISKDELAFFPLLYWPIPTEPSHLDSATIARINAYMKQGGVILFDTQDQMTSFLPGRNAAGLTPLARLLARMDIPPLEPVPSNHVLTRSFYLLNSFPGRWQGGTLWVEASGKNSSSTVRNSDDVSSIIITSNNLAAAWATDDRGRTLFAVSPDGEHQREMSYRTGINIVMYALTGNYKADQVHLPALLRRLGQ
ncbi:MAG: DUF4159 domain-containing protein [bacterium]|nr:DUF4159 domain-containing protein [bacterium]